MSPAVISVHENEMYVATAKEVEGARQDKRNGNFAYNSRRDYFNGMAHKYRWLSNEPEKLVSISEHDTYLKVQMASLPFQHFLFWEISDTAFIERIMVSKDIILTWKTRQKIMLLSF